MSYTVYILKTSGDTFYTGQAKDLQKRLQEHRSKSSRSSKYLKAFNSFELVYEEKAVDLSVALKREYQLKQLTRLQKQQLINSANINS